MDWRYGQEQEAVVEAVEGGGEIEGKLQLN